MDASKRDAKSAFVGGGGGTSCRSVWSLPHSVQKRTPSGSAAPQLVQCNVPLPRRLTREGYPSCGPRVDQTWPGVTQNNNRLLSRFDSTDPAGAWKLYVFDDVTQPDTGDRNGTGTFACGWALQVKGVCTRANANNHSL